MSIAYQPATTTPADSTRARPSRAPHALILVEDPPRAFTFAKIAGLLTLTVFGVAVATAIVAGTALFALLNVG